MKLEICIDTIEAAELAAELGVARIEVCAALSEGGLTPPRGVMEQIGKLPVSSHAMIRPRQHGFVYSVAEIESMKSDIHAATNSGMNGVVFGVLNEDSTLNKDALRQLIDTAGSMEKTLHRAIDMTPDPFEAMEQAIDLGFQRILTSGRCKTAVEGIDTIEKLVSAAKGRIAIMPGSGINVRNVAQIIQQTSVEDVHSSCAALVKPRDYFGFSVPVEVKKADRKTVMEMLDILDKM